MPECEICGRRSDAIFEIDMDGDQLLACERCARGKKIVRTYEREKKAPVSAIRKTPEPAGREEVIEGYGEAIRKARESMGLPMKVLAERISEKESALARIEKEKALPAEKTRLKLEKELGIKLTSRASESKPFIPKKKDEAVTLWDLAKKEQDDKDDQI